jgi:hypothetical protein
MKIIFEINTTVHEPFNISMDEFVTTEKVRTSILKEVEDKTALNKDEILDIFVQHTFSNETLSFANNNQSIKQFMQDNKLFFPPAPLNINKVFVIDQMYREHIVIQDSIPDETIRDNPIKLNHFGDIINTIKKIFYVN